MKNCSKCKQEKPLTDFYKNKSYKDGYGNQCKQCTISYSTDKYQQNKELHFEPRSALVGGKDGLEYIEKLPDHVGQAAVDSMDNIDERFGFVNNNMIGDDLS